MKTRKKVLKIKKFKVANLNMYHLQGGGQGNADDLTSLCDTDVLDTCTISKTTTGEPASVSNNPCSDRCFYGGISG
ncbi:MAG: hypothetical protein AB8B65_03975 [Kordia sp.]|uniref:hypothetical protein n=1 Tax=Kordia sp. TaxID=1965332 RepID=UPI00385E24C8